MPTKGMRNVFFNSSTPSSSPSRSLPPLSPHRTLSESMIDEKIETAGALISKWNSTPSNAVNLSSMFFENREDAKQYLKSVKYLQTALHFLVSERVSSEKIVRAQNLMQTAMKRLEKEFYQILSANRDYLDPESVSTHSSRASEISSFISDLDEDSEDEFRFATENISEVERVSMAAMADLKAIADCMISAGYGKECVKIYNVIRKSIIDEGLYHLGVERLSLQQVQKMDWEVLEIKIKKWLKAVKTAVRTLFEGERILCDHVFSSSDSIRESCFREISKEGAFNLFGFPEMVAKCKKTPEKIFSTLDIYEAIADLWPEIESVFSFESTAGIRSQVVNSLAKLGEGVRTMLADFETAMQKDSAKTPVPTGGVHPLTRYVMNYISFLSDYRGILADIVADWPLKLQSQLPESFLNSLESGQSPISIRLAWLVLVLLCKLDGKAQLNNDVAFSYIFLANNLQYIIGKVRKSNLKFLLGDDWIAEHESKVRQYSSNYERIGWSKVFTSLPENPTALISPEEARDYFSRFNAAFEETYRKQTSWVIADQKLRDEIKVSLGRKLGSQYRIFYERNRVGLIREYGDGSRSIVRFDPDDIGNYLSDLFYGGGSSSGSVSSSSSTSSHLRRFLGR